MKDGGVDGEDEGCVVCGRRTRAFRISDNQQAAAGLRTANEASFECRETGAGQSSSLATFCLKGKEQGKKGRGEEEKKERRKSLKGGESK